MVEELGGFVLLDDLALVHEDHAVGHGLGKAHLVRHADHGDAGVGHLHHHVQHFLDHLRVQRRGGLVKQHDLGLEAQCAGNRHALLLAARELQRVLEGLLGDLDALELLHGFFFGFLLGDFADPHGRERQVFEHGQVREQIELLEHHAHLLADRVNRFDVVGQLNAVNDQPALLVLFQPVDAADQRGLARAGRAADDDAFALGDVQVNVPQHMEIVAVPLVDFVEGDDGFRHGCFLREKERAGPGAQRCLPLLTCFSTQRL